jgi:N6-adenosine-specific RNA methylase IME4/ParB-like chromosome segregation protein Spo0J
MKAHPYADILPLLEGEAFDSLVADIRANGLLEPITIHQGLILDGRNRVRACEAAGIEPRFLEFDGDDPLEFVLSLNVHRRHLDESQRAMVAVRLANLKDGQRAASIEAAASQSRVANLLNVSRSGVQRAREVIDKGAPELIRAVDRGDIAVSVAAGLARAPEGIQQRAVADPKRAHVFAKQERRAQLETELGAKQLAWPTKIFGVFYADPPWPWAAYSQVTGMDRAPSYPVMTLEEIKAHNVQSIAARSAVCFLWATSPMLIRAGEVLVAWGFEYSTDIIWRKKDSEGNKDRAGTGYWNRNVHETLLIGTRGKIPAPAMGTQWPSVIDAPVGKPSEKPAIFREMIEAYYPTLPKIELFARGAARPGWSVWGNEAENPA